MPTTRVILQKPYFIFPAGSVLELNSLTQAANYVLPDDGQGNAASLPVSDTLLCPEHVMEGTDTRKGECQTTAVYTRHKQDEQVGNASPCGQLQIEHVSLQRNPALQSQVFLIDLPPFAEVAEKMVLLDRLQSVTVLEYVLRNYKHSDIQLKWDVSDLNPGFYELRICFPGGWYHAVRFVKLFPHLVEAGNMPAASPPAWQAVLDQMLEKVNQTSVEKPVDLPNEALAFCLEWGEMFEKPTQERMIQLHPELRPDKADELDRLAREVRSFVYALCEQELEGKITEADLEPATKRQYPWVNSVNFYRMKNVGMYYARR